MAFHMTFEGASTSFPCRPDQSVLQAMADVGGGWVTIGCRGGGCGVCRVNVLAGDYDTGTMSAAQVGAEDRVMGIALACQVFPRSDLTLRALGLRNAGPKRDPLALLVAASRAARSR